MRQKQTFSYLPLQCLTVINAIGSAGWDFYSKIQKNTAYTERRFLHRVLKILTVFAELSLILRIKNSRVNSIDVSLSSGIKEQQGFHVPISTKHRWQYVILEHTYYI